MAERRTLGEILQEFGRVTEEEVGRALEHQRLRGGYFGEALLALGILTKDELEWGLASQFDLPYVFPDADSVDPDAAALVTPEWALAHLTLPIMRTSSVITAVVDSPFKAEAVRQLEQRNGLEVELALASGERIRELIRQVYARAVPADTEVEAKASLAFGELLSRSLQAGSGRFGVSVRGHQAVGWYDDRGTTRRRLLTSAWREELEKVLDPPPSRETEGRDRADWSARLDRHGTAGPVQVAYLAAPGGEEYLFAIGGGRAEVESRFPPPGPELFSEIELLVRSGSARFGVSTDPPELARELLPHLPELVLPPFRRAVHLTDGPLPGEGGVFAIVLPAEPRARREALVELRAFRFDAVTVDLDGGAAEEWVDEVLDLAATVFLPLSLGHHGNAVKEAGVRWELRATRTEKEGLDWLLRPLTP